ncbi:alpha/beta fold hydrolase [Tessaracoccus oleiagri]|uniref:Pimeloyl-ACP methyl ester carboxylesterase n=1 Tax=Tessaracoccus oleiagri TaxID=686624 RepID=A0A1G9JBZ0_9ACTN|nr:alpha/beta hydrolase [Tessaracoccus oleiagri]SDL34938.1 Pimeloyl-ACP methyl ester carboxylesterase [Tessaracoccus oleiagri]
MRPLMVLAHGTRTTRAQWNGYDELVPAAELFPIDLPGHGTRQGQPVDYESVIGVFDEAIATARPGQPVILGGHSLGGYLAAMYAEHLTQSGRAAELAGLVLVGTTADPSSPLASIYKGFAKVLPVVGFERMTKIANVMYRALGIKADYPGPESYEALADAWALVFGRCGPHNLRDLECPVVLVNGQFDQMRIHARQYAAQVPGTTIHLVKGASHVLPMTHPEELAAILNRVAESFIRS